MLCNDRENDTKWLNANRSTVNIKKKKQPLHDIVSC